MEAKYGLDFARVKRVLMEEYPTLRKAMDKEAEAWKEYEKAGIGKITKEMVTKRKEASRESDNAWLRFRVKIGWSKAR